MKTTKLLSLLLTVSLALVSCGDDGDIIINNDKGKITGTTNNNKNTSGPTEAQTRYEFPKVRDGQSEVIIHSTKTYGMTYALEWDHSKKATRWVCWEMNADNRAERYSRSQLWPNGDPWAYDPLVPQSEQQATYSELSNSYFPGSSKSDGYYQKGHICASQDRIYDKEANEQTFYMTNIMPMVGNFNGGIWQKLEGEVRKWGKNCDSLYICKGGTIDQNSYILDYTIGNHIVPKYFFMALFKTSSKGKSAIGFWMEHRNENRSNDKLSLYAKSIDQLESLTGIDFFCNLPDETEDKVESAYKLSDWNLQ